MGLNWAQWTLIGLTAVGTFIIIATIGQERKPRTPLEAAIALVINVLSIWLIVKAGSS